MCARSQSTRYLAALPVLLFLFLLRAIHGPWSTRPSCSGPGWRVTTSLGSHPWTWLWFGLVWFVMITIHNLLKEDSVLRPILQFSCGISPPHPCQRLWSPHVYRSPPSLSPATVPLPRDPSFLYEYLYYKSLYLVCTTTTNHLTFQSHDNPHHELSTHTALPPRPPPHSRRGSDRTDRMDL